MNIIPAIIPKNKQDLEEKLGNLGGLVSRVQIDICDGKFVPSQSWPYWKGRYSDDFQAILKEDEGLPFWKEFDFEIDLMVSNPFEVIPDWISAGASALIIHIESVEESVFATELTKLRQQFPKDGAVTLEIGLALTPDTPNEKIVPYLEDIDFVQFMGASKIGFHGVALDERVYDKIRELRNNHPQVTISIDIGVTLENAERLKEEGVDKLVSGSAIFESDSLIETIEEFKNI